MEFIYPTESTSIFVPVGISEEQQEIIFEIGHRFPGQKVYSHLDNVYIGESSSTHQFSFIPNKGWHTLTVVDESGESNSVSFEVVNN